MTMTHASKRDITVSGIAFIAFFILFTIVTHPGSARAEISVSATLSSVTFGIDDGAQLSISVNGASSVDLEIPEVDRSTFEIFQRGRSIKNSWINGKSSSVVTFTCIVRGYKPGEYTIPPITIRAGGSSKTTDEIPFTITAPKYQKTSSGTAASPPSSASEKNNDETAFIRLINPKAQSYVGEIIPVEIKAYFRLGLRANLGNAPALVGDGLVMPQLHGQPTQSREMVGNTAYSVLTWQTALSNIKEGKHPIHLELEATLLIPQRRMSTSMFNQQSPFDDDFFNSVFGGFKEKPIHVTSDNMVFEVLPLPEEGRPANFSGAIGDFAFKVHADPQQVETGEPITLSMSVRGTGNFDRVEAPLFPDTADWKTYTPSVNFHGQNDRSYMGDKVFEQAIVARSPLVNQIPSLSFSYFDPQQGVYITRESAPIAITIANKAESPQAPPLTATAALPPPQNLAEPDTVTEIIDGLAPLHLESGKPVPMIAPLYKKPLFLALILLCCFVLIAVGMVMFYRLREESRPEERLRKQMQSSLLNSFAEVEKALAEKNSTTFLAACRLAIQCHLGIVWKCQPSAITQADLVARIPESKGIIEIFTMAEQAAYGGCQLDSEAMGRYISILKSELEKLI